MRRRTRMRTASARVRRRAGMRAATAGMRSPARVCRPGMRRPATRMTSSATAVRSITARRSSTMSAAARGHHMMVLHAETAAVLLKSLRHQLMLFASRNLRREQELTRIPVELQRRRSPISCKRTLRHERILHPASAQHRCIRFRERIISRPAKLLRRPIQRLQPLLFVERNALDVSTLFVSNSVDVMLAVNGQFPPLIARMHRDIAIAIAALHPLAWRMMMVVVVALRGQHPDVDMVAENPRPRVANRPSITRSIANVNTVASGANDRRMHTAGVARKLRQGSGNRLERHEVRLHHINGEGKLMRQRPGRRLKLDGISPGRNRARRLKLHRQRILPGRNLSRTRSHAREPLRQRRGNIDRLSEPKKSYRRNRRLRPAAGVNGLLRRRGNHIEVRLVDRKSGWSLGPRWCGP